MWLPREVIIKYFVIRFMFDKMWRVLSKILKFLVWGVSEYCNS